MQPDARFANDPFTHRGAGLLKATACLAAAFLLTACAGPSRLLQPPAAETQPKLGWRVSAADGVGLAVQQVIVRNDAASWVREADWDEYALTLRNDGGAPVELRSIELANDVIGQVSHTTATDELKSLTTRNVETMKTAGRIVLIGSTGVVASVMVLAAAAGYTLMAPLLPLALIVGGVSAYRSQSQSNAEAQVIEYEIKRRGLQLPMVLKPGTDLQRSAFFPVTPAPQRLTLRYAVGAERRELVLPLPALAGLHIAPPPK